MNKKTVICLSIIGGLIFTVSVSACVSTICGKKLDFVNIGDPTSEAGHNLTGWGPIEPATNGGNWGQIATETGCGIDFEGATCDKALRVTYSGNNPAEADHPLLDGRMASVTLGHKSWGLVGGLKIRVLDGVANDDFVVFVKNNRGNWEQVYSYVSDPSTTEVWKIHTINFAPGVWFKKSVEVAIMATGSDWAQKNTYGQLGVDWIKLTGKKVICANTNQDN